MLLEKDVTERKVHLLEMKIDVAAAKGTEEEMMKSWQEQLHLQSILFLDYLVSSYLVLSPKIYYEYSDWILIYEINSSKLNWKWILWKSKNNLWRCFVPKNIMFWLIYFY